MQKKLIEQLYMKYYRQAFLYTYSLCRHKEMTEDIVSHAFEKALTSAGYTDEAFYYWLLRVCKNIWLDMLRKEKKISHYRIEAIDSVQADTTLYSLLTREQNQQLYQAIQKLPDNQRALLTLHYFGEVPLTKIAEINHETYTSVKTRLHRARLRLRTIMKEASDEI